MILSNIKIGLVISSGILIIGLSLYLAFSGAI